MRCPSCGSRRVERRPPSQISPHPGYRCRNCGLLMRGRGMALLYVVVLLIGCGLFAVLAVLLAIGEAGLPQILGTPLLGAICSAYAIRQLLRPVPLRSHEDEDEDENEDEDF